MAASISPLSAVASDSMWITWRRRMERTRRNSANRMQCRCRHMLASPRRQLVVFALLSLSSEVVPIQARAGSEEGGLSGALKSLFDPNEKTESGKVLPKAYLKSAREVVKTLRESLQEDTKDMAKFRRTADAARESIRGYLNGWRGQSIVSNEEMAGDGASKSSAPHRVRKRVEAESSSSAASLKRAKDGSAFAKCEECSKDVPVALISFHDCSLDAKIKMNLETQAVEVPTENQKKPTERKKVKSTEPKAKKEKKIKNPNAPKRPPTAFFVFMEDFRKTFKEANPDCKSVASVAKEGGVKWKSMTDEDKKPYIDRAAELKAEYEKAVASNDAENEQDEDDSTEKEVEEQTEKGVEEEIEVDDE